MKIDMLNALAQTRVVNMGDVATELEDIYDILGSSSATSEQRKLSYDAFERIKQNDESFAGAKEVIRRRKSEGSVYTALLNITYGNPFFYNHSNNWTKIYKFYNIDSFITDVIRQAAELNSSLIISGVANVAYQALSRHAKIINSLHSNLVGSDLLRVEIFFIILEKIASAALDYNQKMSLETREYLREYLKDNCLILFTRAQEKINIAHVENELYSPRVISNIYSTVAMLFRQWLG
ncbi:LOW QUALITY PROTEIN: hypothetical protein MXB_234 [Myxobolus squamalis]|nr:LOW QUALITY PROTEIN: hypothetical protein MXB_234 [Myxobolus squamalis]